MNYHIFKIIGCLLLFNVLFAEEATCQIVDTFQFEYEYPLNYGYDSNVATFVLNTHLYSYPIIECYYSGDTVYAYVLLNMALKRKDFLSKHMEIKKVEIMFVGLANYLKGGLNGICWFDNGNPPKQMPQKQHKELFNQLSTKITELTMNYWEWTVIDTDEPLPNVIEVLIPFHCTLILEPNLKDFFFFFFCD